MMFQRYLVFCKQHHLIILIGLLISAVGSQNVSAQQQIALDAHAILEQKCFICHGPTGSFRDALLIERNALIENGTVDPGNPHTSELYNRLITTDIDKRMPLNQPPLSAQAIDTIRNWILAGAPDWVATDTPNGDFISPGEVLNTIETHLMSLSSFDRTFARYFTMIHLYNAGETPAILQEYRKALFKLVNSLSWEREINNPEPIDPQGTIFYIDLRHYEWDVNDGWGQIEAVYPYHISFDAPAQTALKDQLGRLQTEMNSNIPSIHVDWFVATASLPPLYHDLLSLPLTDRELETRLEVDVLRNISNAPGIDVWRAGTNDSGVSTNNRMLERHTSRYGAYWKSYDFAGSVGTQNIFTHPLDFTPDGGEVIFNLPNGLQGYYIANASGFRLDAAPINIVSNPAASDPTVRTGLSCFGCHIEGMNTFEDQVRAVIESNTNPTYDKAQALRLYVEQSEMDALVAEDIERYRVALEATGGVLDGIEPISRFHEAFQGPVDAAYAAAVVGLETEAFLEEIRENVGLQNAGLLVLDSENGSMKRDTWTSNFRDILFALDFPELVDKPPVVPEPDRLPGAVVRIPDPNLRAAIAEELGKSPNAQITVEEMAKLKRLVARNRGLQDLTGLQFATNLNRLHFDDNQISDLSPLAGLIELRELWLHDNPLSDISPVRELTNLTHLEVDYSQVSDISPVRGLINLVHLEVDNTLVSDISPVRGLINLVRLEIQDNSVSDLSPLAGLINLEYIDAWDNPISDLSPLARLTKLEKVRVCCGDISDLTPLANLKGLKELRLVDNEISDLSPLSGLTKLEILEMTDTDVSDLTPLAGLTGLIELEFDGNRAISDISPLAGLTGLNRLHLAGNEILDVSPLAGLTNLKWLNVAENNIVNVSPLAGLTNLKWLGVYNNEISDISPLDELRENITVLWHGNPVFPTDAPKIEGSWLWVILPYKQPSGSKDLLSEASGGTVTETEIATHGAVEGESVGGDVWTFRRLAPMGGDNVDRMLGNRNDTFRFSNMLYGTVSLYSPREQETTMYVGSHNDFKVWLNGTLIYQSLRYHASSDYTDFLSVTLKQGRNVLLVAVEANYNSHFGFEPGTEYTLAMGVGYTVSETPIHLGDTFTLNIRAENISNLAGWQFDIAFDPTVLEAIDVNEGDFLKMDGGTTFFQGGRIDNAVGKITELSVARLSSRGVSGVGTLLQVKFKAKSTSETRLTLQNFEFGATTGDIIPAGPHEIYLTVEEPLPTGDVNRDGRVSIIDLILIAQQLGQRVPANSPVDLNRDGVVSILDIVLAAGKIGSTIAPVAPAVEADGIDPATLEAWIAQARLEDDGSLAFKQGIKNLQKLLASLIPEETALLANYPNPFNPETWIPYQLAESAEVTLTIYDINGQLVRRLALGYQAAGMYRSRSRAAYWDGRNQLGESVASGLYFYTLTAEDFTATRRMLILK